MWTPASLVYGAAIRCRNLVYDRAGGAIRRAAVPVISIGNVTTGGTGKTPLVIEVVRRLRALGRCPAILTRGYRGTAEHPADEVLEFREAVPDVPVVVNPDRVAGAATAHAEHAADCLVLDDGFQHRRLHRDLDVVVIDALEPWGGGRLLPAGRLREPLSSLRRADFFVISRSNQVDADTLTKIDATLERYATGAPVVRALLEAESVVGLDGEAAPPDRLGGRSVLCVCGIGNPRTLQRSVEALAERVCPPLTFRDHHRYEPADVEAIARTAEQRKVDVVVTTRKDWVKLAPLWKQRAGSRTPPLWRLDVRLVLADEAGVVDRHLKQVIEAES
jgi:tetraacyldisaccharide 4'-kinase